MARQLQHAAQAGQALLSAHVAEAASARFDSRPLAAAEEGGGAQVRYHGRPVRAVALLGPRAVSVLQEAAAARRLLLPPLASSRPLLLPTLAYSHLSPPPASSRISPPPALLRSSPFCQRFARDLLPTSWGCAAWCAS